MIFVDTSAWFAVVVPSDRNHAIATTWITNNRDILITTDYVIDETLTLLRARGEPTRALMLGESFFSSAVAQLHFISVDEIRDAWRIFRQYADKDWSFTDCTSKVVMDLLRVSHAFAFDRHFRQFGSTQTVP
jgi:uncharacterized protein